MDYDKLSEYMGGGEFHNRFYLLPWLLTPIISDCTAYAIQHRIRKLKDKANGKASGSTPNTPSKRKKRSNAKTDNDEESEAADPITPKKIKAEPIEEYDNVTNETI